MPRRTVTQVLNSADSGQHRLLHKAARLQQLQIHLQKFLPDALLPHVQLANLRGTRLVLTADGNAWASRLRYLTPELLRQLNAAGWPCQQIDVKVAANFAPPPAPVVQRCLSDTARRLLNQTADYMDDPELAARLKKLAQVKKPS